MAAAMLVFIVTWLVSPSTMSPWLDSLESTATEVAPYVGNERNADRLPWPAAWSRIKDITAAFVLVSAQSDLNQVKNTWGKAFNGTLYFVGNCNGCTIRHEHIRENRQALVQKTLYAFDKTFELAPWAQFVLKADMDTYVVPENLFGWLASLGIADGGSQYLYAGAMLNEFGAEQLYYPSGGAGYVISRKTHASLRHSLASTNGTCLGHDGGGFWEDAFVGGCLKLASVPVTHSPLFFPDSRPIDKVGNQDSGLPISPIRRG